jgi:hypothetical protein
MPTCLSDPFFLVCEPEFAWLRDKREGWQFGEQGLIDAILQVISPALKVAVEIGAGDGVDLPLTTERLVHRGWRVIAYECDEEKRNKLASLFPEIEACGEYTFSKSPECSVLVIDIDGADSLAMGSALESSIPSLLVVEHYDQAGPYVTDGCYSFDEPVPEWLLGMPLAIPESPGFVIQSHYQHLDTIAEAHGMVPACRTRVNSFYVPSRIAEELRNV